MKLVLHEYTLPLRHPFTISRSSITAQRTLIAELQEDGLSGFGEATQNAYYNVTVESSRAALEAVAPRLEALTLETPTALWEVLAPHLSPTPFAQCALDEAAHDLWGKKHGKSVQAMWGLTPSTGPVSSFTIGLAPLEDMVAKLLEIPDWPTYKIKLGGTDDLRIIETLRGHTGAPLRVDANCAWDLAATLRHSTALPAFGVEFIEQPMPPGNWLQLGMAFAHSPLPLIADESCRAEGDVARCVRHFHGVNIKLMKCGGLTPARRMLAQARALGLRTMVGCMTESTVGISSIAQLLPLLDYVDMDGANLLQEDTATGVRVERGRALFPETPGCGVTLL